MMLTINIAEDFSKQPSARYYSDGPFSGEEFFELHLNPKFKEALDNNLKLNIILDGTDGYAASFLSEVFGLLSEKYTPEVVLKNIKITSVEEPFWINKILFNYIKNPERRNPK